MEIFLAIIIMLAICVVLNAYVLFRLQHTINILIEETQHDSKEFLKLWSRLKSVSQLLGQVYQQLEKKGLCDD